MFREGCPHKGVVLLRLDDERVGNKIEGLRGGGSIVAEPGGGHLLTLEYELDE